jgi:hypothetical protein
MPQHRPEVVSVAVVKFEDDPDTRHAGVTTGSPPCRDGGFAALFVIQAAIVAVMAVVYGIPEYTTFNAQHAEEAEDETSSSSIQHKKKGSPLLMLAVLVATCVLSGAASLALFQVALKNPLAVIQFGLRGMVAFCASLTLLMLLLGSIVGALLCGIITALILWYVKAVQDRVPFAAANLAIATAAIKKFRGNVRVAAWALVLQCVWVLTWLLACVGYGARQVRLRQSHAPDPSAAYEADVLVRYGAEWDGAPPASQALGLREPLPKDLGSDGAAEYYGLFAGCRAVVYAGPELGETFHAPSAAGVDAGSAGEGYDLDGSSSGSSLAGNVYCACGLSGSQVSGGECDSSDFAKQEVAAHFLIYLSLLLCLFWGSKVVSGVVHVTSAGTVAAWWFGADAYSAAVSDAVAYSELDTEELMRSGGVPGGGGGQGASEAVPEAKPLGARDDEEGGSAPGGPGASGKKAKLSAAERGGVVRAALRRALGPSFGSICFGCLIVAVLSTIEALVSMVRDQLNGGGGGDDANLCACCLCCVEFAVGCLRDVMEYFNRWAFTYVAVYGDDFVSAGRATNALFKRRGWSSIIADQLCSMALSWAALCIALGEYMNTMRHRRPTALEFSFRDNPID